MTKKSMGCLAVVILLTGMVLAGCVGSEAGGQAQSEDTADQADDIDQNQNTTDTDTDTDVDDGNVTDDEDAVEDYRIPSDAMDAEPAKTQNGMAKFEFDTNSDAPAALISFGSDRYEIHSPGDVAFFDIHISQPDAQGGQDSDYDLYLYNESNSDASADSGAALATSTSPTSDEYIFWRPEQGVEQNFTLEVRPWTNVDPTGTAAGNYQLEVWVWTHEEWNASHPFTDVWEKEYEWGQVEVCPQEPACVSLVAWSGDYLGITSDGEANFGGYSWNGCGDNGGGPGTFPCPREDPYKKVSIVINDDVAGQQVAAIMTTCSNDGDSWCGETGNVEQEARCEREVPLFGGITCQEPGPNELRATFCGVINGVTRDGTTDKDGTGPGVWDQRGEQYETADGSYEEHPGVESLAVFLRGPQRGGGGICADANPYHGPTTGTITIIAQK